MNIIIGKKQSGKTNKLIKELKDYLDKNPEGTAIFITPFTMNKTYLQHELSNIDRLVVLTWAEFMVSNRPFPLKKSKCAVFIDDIDIILNQLTNRCIGAVTFTDSQTFIIKNEEEE